jgi:hypothetical protein
MFGKPITWPSDHCPGARSPPPAASQRRNPPIPARRKPTRVDEKARGLKTAATSLEGRGRREEVPIGLPERLGAGGTRALATASRPRQGGLSTCTEGQSDGLGEYRTFKKSLGGGERGLLEIEPSPALERGHYEKEMDHRRNCGI